MAEREREKKKQSKTAEAADYHFRQSIDYRIKFNTKKNKTKNEHTGFKIGRTIFNRFRSIKFFFRSVECV